MSKDDLSKKVEAGARVALKNISKVYTTREGKGVHALDDINLDFEPGSFVACVGPSGCGKSTLLSLLAGITPPTCGELYIDNKLIEKPHPKVGVVFQSDLLLYWRTILDNILLPIEIKKLNVKNYSIKAKDLLKQVGLDGFGNKLPTELSGGMRQRAAICRALIQEPDLLLMDEPFGALDALTREQMILDLQKMWMTLGNTILFITHGIEEAVFLADRVLVMSPRPGKIELDLKIELQRPRPWSDTHEDPKFSKYVRKVREIFESQGILVDH
ncbi:MAG: ABC transporter ATP-binding protein [Paracoccaceae bacterium]|nr:ABC transporter ATP-binding protein [Paracoccaceae bacterium]